MKFSGVNLLFGRTAVNQKTASGSVKIQLPTGRQSKKKSSGVGGRSGLADIWVGVL